MNIIANIEPLPFSKVSEDKTQTTIYRQLELKMQQMGFLVKYREELNWTNKIESVALGDKETLLTLKKTAAKNDNVLLLYAKLLKKTVFQNLIIHENSEGYYLPFRFDEPFFVKINDKKVYFGSSVRLLDELTWLEQTMIASKHQEKLLSYYENLKAVCEKSIETNSPIILEKES
ncbi:hypothetical protein ACJ2A9_03680 [Anaerobacillus sp. MEB173]|uniref:hypothetical protein n=1 Tax=Anaerobacillus sp. MEB173 TaxID=3383345 RepID=UPI003F8DFADD